jgi:hypothetical protein
MRASEFTEKQKAIIYNEAIKTLTSFQLLTNQLADAVIDLEEANKLSQSLTELFVNRKAIIFNDLDPAGLMSESFELETYLTNLILWYPDGLKITLDFKELKAGNIISHGNDIYTVDLMTTKTNNGNYLNRQKNETKSSLLYRVAFFQQGNNFENFKIAGVRNSTSKASASSSNNIAEVKSVEFSEKDMQLIKEQSKSLINDYINFLNLLADPNETNEDKGYYRVSFMSLFKDTTLKVSNDIEPDPSDRWVSVSDYQEKFINSYPEGIRNLGVNIDSAEYGKVIPEGKENFYINGYIDKYFSGKYQSKTIFRDNSRYDFKISFERDENTFKNFHLASIDKFGVDLYDVNAANTINELPNLSIESISRKGLYYGLEFGFGQTLLSDPNLTGNDVLKWNLENKAQYSINLKGIYYLNGYIGFSAGFGYSHAAILASLYGDFQNTSLSTDAGGNSHLKSVSASIDSTINFNYFNIPIAFVFHSNPSPEKWSIFAEVGINTGINANSNSQTTGQYSTSGYYEQNPVSAQYFNYAELGFVNKTIEEDAKKTELNPINISLITAIGATYPLDYFTTLFIGAQYNMGLSNVSENDTYTDYLGNILPLEKHALSNFGVKFGINYKF